MKFLKIERILGVPAAIDDIHHGHRQPIRRRATEILVQRDTHGRGRRPGSGHRDAKYGVGAELRLVLGAVERNQCCINGLLRCGVRALKTLADRGRDVRDGVENALAPISRRIAVAKLERFVPPCRGS